MMSPADSFVARMIDVFAAPQTENPKAYVDEMRKAIAGWDQATLDKAADRLVKTAKFFPRPAEVIEVCEAIAASRVVPDTRPQHGDWTSDALRTASGLIRSDMGREAAKDGWITQLHDFCRQKRRLPKGFEIAKLKTEAKLFDDAYSTCCAGKGGTLTVALAKLGETFLERRNKLAAIANGEATQ
jgi:hypothetical protein